MMTDAAVMLARLDVARQHIDIYGDSMTAAEVVELTTHYAITGTIVCPECDGRKVVNIPMYGERDCTPCAGSGVLELDPNTGDVIWKG